MAGEIYEINSPMDGPVRLFVGGVHGREGRATAPILRRLIRSPPPLAGSIVVVPSVTGKPTKHISTLRDAYYSTDEGCRLLKLIDHYLPAIYVELHCYVERAFHLLTDLGRRQKRGVPPLIELENKVLIGSVSPHLLQMYIFDLCLILEVPCRDKSGWTTALGLLQILKYSTTRMEAINELKAIYPSQMEKAITLMERWSREHLSK